MTTDPTHARIRGVAIWFYIIAAFQLFAAYTMWSTGSARPDIALGAMVLAGFDIVIGALFVLFGYFAAKKQPWAFVAGLVLYGLRAVLQFFELFNPVVLLIRGFLMFRIYKGLQACLAVQRAEQATKLMAQQGRLEMPQAPSTPATPAWNPKAAGPAVAPPAWTPSRGPAVPQPQPEGGHSTF